MYLFSGAERLSGKRLMAEQAGRYEWKELSADLAIRQGDLLVSRSLRTRKILRMAVVITADCDIDKQKHGPQIACLNVQFHDEYIKNTWAETSFNASKAAALKQAVDKLRSALRKLGNPNAEISAKAAEDWLVRTDLAEIASELSVSAGDLKSFIESLAGVQAAVRKSAAMEKNSPFERLAHFHAALKGKSADEAQIEALKSAHGATLPSDVFFLPGFPTDLNRSVLIMLREMIGIDTGRVTTRHSEVLDESTFLRVGRLRSTFKYALSQSFASLYSKIGLPGAYEQRAKLALERTKSYDWK